MPCKCVLLLIHTYIEQIMRTLHACLRLYLHACIHHVLSAQSAAWQQVHDMIADILSVIVISPAL
jgi:hypothetical protein